MKVSGMDVGPLSAITAGALAGAVFFGTLVFGGSHRDTDEPGASVKVRGTVVDARAVSDAPVRIRQTAEGGLQVAEPEPLVYLDGIRLQDASVINGLDPDRIDRVEVVKGGAAVQLFGTEAAGGVIQIFLKQGKGSPGR